MRYFAYGPNMSKKHMSKCFPSCQFLFRAYLENHRFVYDGYSEKCKGAVSNILYEYGSRVWGAVYSINRSDFKKLDTYERVEYGHYIRKTLAVINDEGQVIDINVYMRKKKKSTSPSEEYRQTVIRGAIESLLPVGYINKTLK